MSTRRGGCSAWAFPDQPNAMAIASKMPNKLRAPVAWARLNRTHHSNTARYPVSRTEKPIKTGGWSIVEFAAQFKPHLKCGGAMKMPLHGKIHASESTRFLLLPLWLSYRCSRRRAPRYPCPSYTDAKGYADVQALKCPQLASTFQKDADDRRRCTAGWNNGLRQAASGKRRSFRQSDPALQSNVQAG